MYNLHALSERIRGDEFSGTIAVGQRVRAGIRGHDGIVVAIRGQQHPETVRHLAGVISMGGSAEFDVVFSNGSVSTRLPEAILRGSQWHIYGLVADRKEIVGALAFADMTAAKKNEEVTNRVGAPDKGTGSHRQGLSLSETDKRPGILLRHRGTKHKNRTGPGFPGDKVLGEARRLRQDRRELAGRTHRE